MNQSSTLNKNVRTWRSPFFFVNAFPHGMNLNISLLRRLLRRGRSEGFPSDLLTILARNATTSQIKGWSKLQAEPDDSNGRFIPPRSHRICTGATTAPTPHVSCETPFQPIFRSGNEGAPRDPVETKKRCSVKNCRGSRVIRPGKLSCSAASARALAQAITKALFAPE